MLWIIVPVLIVALLIVFVCWIVLTVNGFRKREIKIGESLSDIEVALTKRYDLLTKLLDAAKGYMSHERELYAEVIRMRRGMSLDELNQAEGKMSRLSGRLFAVAENYPELRSSGVFLELQKGIRDAEEHLQAARRLYNADVRAYNTSIAVFPASLLARGRQPKGFFEAEERKRQDVEMKF